SQESILKNAVVPFNPNICEFVVDCNSKLTQQNSLLNPRQVKHHLNSIMNVRDLLCPQDPNLTCVSCRALITRKQFFNSQHFVSNSSSSSTISPPLFELCLHLVDKDNLLDKI